MIAKIKPYMMPLAMLLGGLFYEFFGTFSFLTPYLIFAMLLISYLSISFGKIRFSRMHLWMILFQLIAAVGFYLLLLPINSIVAQAAFICILAPTATAAPVIAGMLGGNVANVTAYSLVSNMTIVLVAPLLFTWIGHDSSIPFFDSVLMILGRVSLLLFLPLVLAYVIQKCFRESLSSLEKIKTVSFYLWLLALTIITGKTVLFVIGQGNSNLWIELLIALTAFSACIMQFFFGRKIGSAFDETVAGGQGLGQKNTILAIWMVQTFLNPVASLGPGAYILWQNIVNSYQVWRNRKNL